ncbi:MAG: carboxypeptidase-like regulatory domain-containing protein [Chloroflexota bacterium]
MKRMLPLIPILALLLTACGGQPTPSPAAPTLPIPTTAGQPIEQPQPTGTATTAQPEDTADSLPGDRGSALRPGVITGNVTDAQGKPLAAVKVIIRGTTLTGSNTYFETQVDDKGRYAQQVPDGVYEITASVNALYNERTYNLWLHPVDNVNTPSQSSVNGLAKDFVWRLSGPTPNARTQPNSPSSYYGGTIDLGSDEEFQLTYNNKMVERYVYPAGSKIKLELTPDGPLLDGSKGEIIVREVKAEELPTGAVRDVPLGDYSARASLVEENGTVTPLLVASVIPGRPFGEAVTAGETGAVQFVPSRMGQYGIEPMTLFVVPK